MISRTSPGLDDDAGAGPQPAAASARLTAAVASSDGIGVVPGDGFRSERIRMRQFSCTAATASVARRFSAGRACVRRRRPGTPAAALSHGNRPNRCGAAA